MDPSETSQLNDNLESLSFDEIMIPSSMKFLIANVKNIVSTELTSDNYATWRYQILKLFRANRFLRK